jgi:hypothetical protein
MSVGTTLEPSTWRAFAFSKASLAQVGDARELLRKLLILCLLALGADFGQGVLEGFLLAAELRDALRDQFRASVPTS